ncbi:hypothetical protein GCM10010123_08960 [Pilimelia anulata]|uniref:Uncharacterized protein n=1 Tax=Pilimelia anulata TaxID=53371 RepID=A0A8J3B171_9ACTN|nr:hypothetical protein GCM10010123_08960 [Pilimelia anulata]
MAARSATESLAAMLTGTTTAVASTTMTAAPSATLMFFCKLCSLAVRDDHDTVAGTRRHAGWAGSSSPRDVG